MSLEFTSIPLAWLAGVLGIVSPCVWPLVPIVMASASSAGRWGPLYLALGLSTAFALAGGLLTYILLNLGLDPTGFRWFAAGMLVLVGLILLVKPLGDWVSQRLSLLSSRFNSGAGAATPIAGQFGVGMLLGLVWLPCVGPTLGAAIALASMGQNMSMAFLTMFAFGLGTASALIAVALVSGKLLARWRPALMSKAGKGKKLLGALLLALGLAVLTGLDKLAESWALQYLPDWALSL